MGSTSGEGDAGTTKAASLAQAHIFSVDVEEHFHVNAFERFVPRESWERHPSRVVPNTLRLLDLLDRHGALGTFFVLGWVAERQPDLVREIARRGHEVASHGWWHRRVPTLTPEEFRREVRDSRQLLRELSGQEVLGYRAPSFSIIPGVEWAFDVLLEEGYRYDSSRYPIHRRGYGSPDAPRVPHHVERPAGRLLELPLPTTMLFGMRVPAAGGGYFRQLPYALTERTLREHAAAGEAAMFYIHPWEYDATQPRLAVPMLTRIRHYRNLDRTWERMERMLGTYKFKSVFHSQVAALR